jgi:hypothetical protein
MSIGIPKFILSQSRQQVDDGILWRQMITQGHYCFHSVDGRAVRLFVPSEIWEEKHIYGRLEGWLAHELHQVGENEDGFDLEPLAKQLALDINAGRAEWEELQELRGTAAKFGMGEPAKLLRSRAPEERDWFVPGLLARGGVTLIGGREKLSGKSTLVFNLIGKLERQEATIFGPAYREAVKTLMITEEPEYAIQDKCDRFDLNSAWIVQDWAWPLDKVDGNNLQEKWVAKLVQIEQLARATGCAHVVIDPLSRIAAVEDEAGRELGMRAEAISSFAYRSKLAVTIIHHQNKRNDAASEDRFRGSTSLTAAVDQMVGIERRGRKTPRRRYAVSYGRVEDANWERAFELDEDGITYRDLDPETDAHEEMRADLLLIRSLPDAQTTIKQFCEVLCLDPEDGSAYQSARRRLDKLVDGGLADKDKDGRGRIYVAKDAT